MKKNLTELVMILDRSGSMSGLESDTIGGYNGMLQKQRETEGEVLVSTVLFDHNIEVLHDRVPLDKVPEMTGQRVNVGSGTLYTLLEQFLQEEWIRETRVEGRRRSYILTEKGKEVLEKECSRLSAQLEDYEKVFGKGAK